MAARETLSGNAATGGAVAGSAATGGAVAGRGDVVVVATRRKTRWLSAGRNATAVSRFVGAIAILSHLGGIVSNRIAHLRASFVERISILVIIGIRWGVSSVVVVVIGELDALASGGVIHVVDVKRRSVTTSVRHLPTSRPLITTKGEFFNKIAF